MRSMLFLLLLCAATAHAQIKLPEEEAKQVQEFMTSRIPAFKIKDASLYDILAVMHKEWVKQYPEEPFPLAIAGDADCEETKDGPSRLTMEFPEATFFKDLEYMAHAWCCAIGYGYSPGMAFILHHEYGDDQMVKEYPLTSGLLAALGLKRDASRAQLKEAFAHMGIHWEKWMVVEIFKNKLLVKASPQIVENIDWIYQMIDAGIKIDGTLY